MCAAPSICCNLAIAMATTSVYVRWKQPVDFEDYHPTDVRIKLVGADGRFSNHVLSASIVSTVFSTVLRGEWYHLEIWYFTPNHAHANGDPAVIQSRSAAIDFYLP